jgi:hypothetical protein
MSGSYEWKLRMEATNLVYETAILQASV